METIVLIGIGAAALGYFAHTVWRGLSCKEVCNCASSGSCSKAAGGCHCPGTNLLK